MINPRKMHKPILHIFIPSYKKPDLLVETLSQLIKSLNEELNNGTVVATCVDDASPQPLKSIVTSYGNNLVEYVRNEVNLGIIPNFNYCITIARAPFVMFLGADDLILPSYWTTLKTMMQEHPDASVYSPGVAEIDINGNRSHTIQAFIKKLISPLFSRFYSVSLRGNTLALRLAIGDFLYFPALCWRTEDLHRTPFAPEWLDAADWHRLFLCALNGDKIVINNKILTFYYRRHSSSASEKSAKDGIRFENEFNLSMTMSKLARTKGWWMTAALNWLSPTIRLHGLHRKIFGS